jgi:ABC-type transport system involved in multi-copper enzyme maturation permease subunit
VIAALQCEYRKFFSTRMWWVLSLCAAGYIAFFTAMMALAFHFAGDPQNGLAITDSSWAHVLYSMAPSYGYVFPALIGAMAITQEYRHKTLTPTFLVEPRRSVVLTAKFISALPMGLAMSAICMASAILPTALIFGLGGEPTGLGTAETWGVIVRMLLALALWAVLGVGFGTLLHNQVLMIVLLLVLTQLIEPVAQIVALVVANVGDPAWWKDLIQDVLMYFPGAASNAISGTSFYDMMGMDFMPSALPWGAAIAVLAGWGVLFGVLGYLFTFRRDVS